MEVSLYWPGLDLLALVEHSWKELFGSIKHGFTTHRDGHWTWVAASQATGKDQGLRSCKLVLGMWSVTPLEGTRGNVGGVLTRYS